MGSIRARAAEFVPWQCRDRKKAVSQYVHWADFTRWLSKTVSDGTFPTRTFRVTGVSLRTVEVDQVCWKDNNISFLTYPFLHIYIYIYVILYVYIYILLYIYTYRTLVTWFYPLGGKIIPFQLPSLRLRGLRVLFSTCAFP